MADSRTITQNALHLFPGISAKGGNHLEFPAANQPGGTYPASAAGKHIGEREVAFQIFQTNAAGRHEPHFRESGAKCLDYGRASQLLGGKEFHCG